jgi:CRP/FNR family transcriptional regulator, anaerobic regulatory protein
MNESIIANSSEQELAQLKNLFEKYGTKRKVAKGKQIITQGEKSTFFFYVLEGGFRSYISRGDREYILGFSFKENIDCCPYSLFSNNQNTYTLEAYIDSEIIKVSLSDLNKFTKEFKDFEKFIHRSLIDYIGLIENTLFDLISKTAEERYLDLCNEYREEIKLITLTDLAKYLGISLERLSRIRKKCHNLT